MRRLIKGDGMVSLFGEVKFEDLKNKEEVMMKAIDSAISEGIDISDDSMVASVMSLANFNMTFRVVYDPEYIASFYNECVNGGISVETVGDMRKRYARTH